MGKTCLCMDVGGSSIKYAKLDEKRILMDYGKVPTPHEGTEAYLSRLQEIYRQFEGQVEGISMSVPGIIDSKNGICITAGNLRFADGLPLVEEMERRCKVPAAIMNDAKSAALAEAAWGALKDCKDGIVLVLGTGVGGALVKDGEVHMGSHFAAGEFSFAMMGEWADQESNIWGLVSGNPRLLQMAARARRIEPDTINGEDVFRWINQGDTDMLEVLDEFTRPLARMIMNLQFIYDPDRFAIGGGISRQPKLLESIRKNLDRFYAIYPIDVPPVELAVCRFFNEANLMGAYRNYLRTFGEEQ